MEQTIKGSNTYPNKVLLDQKTEIIIGTSFDVMNELGSGFLDSVYHQAFAICQDGQDRKDGTDNQRQYISK